MSSAALSRPGSAQAVAVPAVETFTYKVAAGCQIKADVYGAAPGGKRPAVMWIHGGALMGGSRTPWGSPVTAKLLKLGYVIVSIDYRLAPQTKVPGIIEDVQDAWRWVRQEGPRRFGIDPDRIATAGGSAGGYLTLMTGFCLEPRPRALVSYFGYGDIDGPWLSQPDEFYRRQPLVDKEAAYRSVGGPAHSEPRGNSGFYLYCRQNGIWPNEVSGHDPHAEPKWFDPYCPIRNVTAKYPPPLDFLGCRHDTKRFLFRAPNDAQDVPVCQDCALRDGCYRGHEGARQITVPFARLPWIDPEFPQLSRRFAKVMAKRTAPVPPLPINSCGGSIALEKRIAPSQGLRRQPMPSRAGSTPPRRERG